MNCIYHQMKEGEHDEKRGGTIIYIILNVFENNLTIINHAMIK
jgi:hypothetical protein